MKLAIKSHKPTRAEASAILKQVSHLVAELKAQQFLSNFSFIYKQSK